MQNTSYQVTNPSLGLKNKTCCRKTQQGRNEIAGTPREGAKACDILQILTEERTCGSSGFENILSSGNAST